jgi:hypothetical protein
MATLITAFIVIWLLLLPLRIAMRHRRVVSPAVQVIIVQPGQIPQQPPATPPAPAQSQYSRPFSPGFLGLNRQN